MQILLSKEEFRDKLLADQEKRKEKNKRKKIVKVGLPFKQEAYVDVVQLVKENYPEAEIQKDKEIIIDYNGYKHSVKVIEKRGKVTADPQSIKENEFRGELYAMILKYYVETESKNVFFCKEGVVIQRGEADYVVKITKKKG